MARANGNRILKDVNGNISDHLQNHIHLTNCIHLKNHIHKNSPILGNRHLLKDLVALQKSRPLRDPSTSPRSVVDVLRRIGERDVVLVSRERRVRREESSRKVSNVQEGNVVSMPFELIGDITDMSDGAALSCNHSRKRVDMNKREKRRRFRSGRRNRASVSARGAAKTQPEVSVASNSCRMGKEVKEYDDDQNVEHRCGIHWNSSRIHDKGREMPLMSEQSSSSTMSEREALPLLVDSPRLHDYSGELGAYADKLLRRETDSERRTLQRQQTDRHQSLTQKYIPTTFRDLVGQNLVVRALSNAITKRKIGLLYVFYGPNGTGKTTCARIFAKALNCQSSDSTKPCGFCDSCISQTTGKSRNVREIGPVSKIDLESVIELLHDMIASHHRTQYGVFIFDDCDNLTSDCWSVILKVIDRAPRHVVFVLVCTSLDVLPHVIISRCQKFLFNKLKETEIIYSLRLIAIKEDLEVDKDALKLIASSSNGSLRDAEMTLEQLSLLGQKISLCLVQELVGLISDEKLVDLLDSALSADTINTVKNLRDITESGIEPLTLMSQLATVITDILAGSYNCTRRRPKMKFFECQALSKENMEKLRQALKTLSEAEKQLRVSKNKMTWLTAALLQLVPDQQYVLPRPSADRNSDHSLNNSASRQRKSETRTSQDGSGDNDGVRRMNKRVEEIWLEVLETISIKSLREFMFHQGKLISLSYGAAPTARLLFNSQLTKSDVEKFRSHILQAFESVLRSPVTIEIRYKSSSCEVNKSEIVEVEPCPIQDKCSDSNIISTTTARSSDRRGTSERSTHSLSLVRSKVSLAHMIQHAEGSQRIGWTKRKPVSIAEKVERDNLRLESRSRRLLCWNPPTLTRRPKFSSMQIRTRRTQNVLKFVSCGRCVSRSSSRY